MILSNVNIGTGPSAGDGDSLRTAFNTINSNFTKIQSNVNALTNSVSSVAGRTGNITLTTQDIVGINNYATISYVSSQIANVSGGNVNLAPIEANIAALQADVNTLYGNAGVQSSTLATLTSNAAAQAGSLATLTSNAAVQAGELATLIANAAAQAGQIAAAGGGNYGDSNVASYLTTYGGNVSVGNVIFDDLSVQTTAYTGTQWRSNLSSNLTVKPSWLSYYPGLKNQEGTQYGFAAAAGFYPGGMFFAGNSDNDFAYPIQTNLHFHEQDKLEVTASFYFAHVGNDHGLCIFPADVRPIWQSSANTTRIAFQYSAGIPVLYGQTTANTAPGTPVLNAGDFYTIKFTYDPGNTVTVETFSGNAATGSPIDSRTISEVLPAGNYRLGFDADNDVGGVKSYFTNLIVRTLTDTVVNDLEVQGQITGNLIPSANVTYSLGDSTHQWKDLWVSNNTIYINSVPLSVDAGGNLLVNGAPVSAGTATDIVSNGFIGITNADSNADISLLSGDDITLQGKNKTTSDSEGGDIFIYAGNGGNADEGDAAGSGGDITIRAGQGGIPSAAYNGGFGGTLDLYGGTGGDSDPGNNRSARDGGRARLQAGSAGSNNGNVALGAEGGPVEITAGQTTLTDTNGGPVIITSGQAGANALAGYVEINIPGSDIGPGGSWYFTGTGRTLEAPQDGEIWQPNAGNLTVASAGNVFVRSYDGDQHEWQFGHNGDLTIPGNITMGPGSGRLISVVTPAPGIVNWEFGMDGNLTVPGNINHANGVNILSGLGSADFNNVSLIGTPGNLTIQSPAANSTTTVTQEGGFGGGSGVNTITGGVASSPGFALIQPGWTVTGNNLVGTTTVTNVSGPDGYGTYTITTDTTEVDPFWYNDVYTFTSNTPSYSNLVISSGNIVSGNSRVNFIANSSGDGNGYSTIELRPDADLNTDQYIIVDPTGGEPGHIHLRAGGTQDASGADLYLGGELTAVRVSDTSGIVTVRTTNIGDPNITMDWAFQPDGNLYFPGIGNNRIGESEPGLVVSSDNSVVLQSNNAGTSKEWLFNANASITFPDMTVQTTAWTGTVAYGNTIALGYQTGNTSQGNNAVAIGSAAGQTSQGAKAIGIGEVAGRLNQGIESVGLGAGAGEQNQGAYAIAIGSTTAYQNQGVGAVAIGTSAGALYQGEHAIAIGTGAGAALQGNNSIILNATGSTLDQTTDDTFTVKPIRAASAGNVLYYDPSSGEITYSTNSGGGSYGNANVAVFLGSFGSNAITTTGNISAANVRANNNVHFGTGNARITSDDNTSVYLTPDTAANALAGVKIGGNGYLLASNGARNITLNYGSVNGAVGLQANVTVGTSASSILTVNGNVTANNISTIGSILSTGASGKIGYSAGGYVVQSGNTSGVTLNTVSGNIQLDTVNIAVNTTHSLTLTSNKLDANDIILVQGEDSSAIDLLIGAYYITTNTAFIYLRNISGSSLGPIAPKLKFIIVKAPSS